MSGFGDCNLLLETTSCDCSLRSLDRASASVACGVLSSSNTALVSASISTGSLGIFAIGIGFLLIGSDDDLGVCTGDTVSEAGKVGGERPGDPSGDGTTEAAAEGATDGAAEPNRKAFEKSGILKFFIVSDFAVSGFFNAGILST